MCENTGDGRQDVVDDLKKQTRHLQVLPSEPKQDEGAENGMVVNFAFK